MTDLFTAILGTACICASSITLIKICAMRNEDYIVVAKEDYETLLKQKIINAQPPPELPSYSEKDSLLPSSPIPQLLPMPQPIHLPQPIHMPQPIHLPTLL